jgi:putative pyruvate formate lyase activating enzyme
MPHKGEEPPLVTGSGSGTVFFSGCNAACIFCQNYQISQLDHGCDISPDDLAENFLHLQRSGCCNINWVTATPQLPFALTALALAIEKGLDLPLVYNTNSYLHPEVVSLLDGIVDIYLPDLKYSESFWAESFSNLPDYFDIAIHAITEMIRQRGPLKINAAGTATSGVLVRHLILPQGSSGYRKILRSLAAVNSQIPVSLMSQYRPKFLASKNSVLNREITSEEYQDAIDAFHDSGLQTGFYQDPTDFTSTDPFFPDFQKNQDLIFS